VLAIEVAPEADDTRGAHPCESRFPRGEVCFFGRVGNESSERVLWHARSGEVIADSNGVNCLVQIQLEGMLRQAR
jgi:hypothetical protein